MLLKRCNLAEVAALLPPRSAIYRTRPIEVSSNHNQALLPSSSPAGRELHYLRPRWILQWHTTTLQSPGLYTGPDALAP